MFDAMKPHLERELEAIRAAGLWKEERVLASAQGPEVTLADGRRVLGDGDELGIVGWCCGSWRGLLRGRG